MSATVKVEDIKKALSICYKDTDYVSQDELVLLVREITSNTFEWEEVVGVMLDGYVIKVKKGVN